MESLTKNGQLRQTLVLAMVALSGFGFGTILAKITSVIAL